MRAYELMYILAPELDEEAVAKQTESFDAFITSRGGEVSRTESAGKRRLAYEIDKIKEGFYYFIEFSADGDAPREVESRIRIMESVLRYLTIRLDED